jgi:hypothetical protein
MLFTTKTYVKNIGRFFGTHELVGDFNMWSNMTSFSIYEFSPYEHFSWNELLP